MYKLLTTTLSIAAIMGLVGCGDSTSSSVYDTTTISGVAVDPELIGARVFIDSNANGHYDDNETAAMTDANGNYTLSMKNSDLNKTLMVQGGIDKITHKAFQGIFRAELQNGINHQNLTPLTTVVQSYYEQSQGKSLEEVKSEIAKQFNIKPTDLDSNPVEEGNEALLQLAMQLDIAADFMQSVDENLTYETIYNTYAELMKTGTTSTTLISDLADKYSNTLSALDKAKLKDLTTEISSIDLSNMSAGSLAITINNIETNISNTSSLEALSTDLSNEPSLIIDKTAYSSSLTSLSDDVKYTLAYMFNEERLAYDIYNALAKLYPTENILVNIPTRGEAQHIALVEGLVEKYDINITNLVDYKESYSAAELHAMPAGQYAIDKIQTLYNTLYEKGAHSMQDALEVGCMVEVTDVDDLDKDIAIAQASGADDVVTVFENLRSGSYSHYWSFDNALKNIGVSNGCASLGAEYTKTQEEYPVTYGSGGQRNK